MHRSQRRSVACGRCRRRGRPRTPPTAPCKTADGFAQRPQRFIDGSSQDRTTKNPFRPKAHSPTDSAEEAQNVAIDAFAVIWSRSRLVAICRGICRRPPVRPCGVGTKPLARRTLRVGALRQPGEVGGVWVIGGAAVTHLCPSMLGSSIVGKAAPICASSTAAGPHGSRSHSRLSPSIAAPRASGSHAARHDGHSRSGDRVQTAAVAQAVTRPPFEVADIVRRHGDRFLETHRA